MLANMVRSIVLASALFGCAQGATGGTDPGGDKVAFTGVKATDWAQIVALEDEAKALVKPDGCASVGQCRTAPVGSRPCGGPRYYLVYCSLTTDSAALYRKLDAVAAAEREFNNRYQLASTCEFRMPPNVGLVGGSCQAQPGPTP